MKNQKVKNMQQGFTLVEVIVVAIIVAALAAVAVPLYLNYVETSRVNSASNAAGSVASFCGACINSGGTIDNSAVGSVICTPNNTSITKPPEITIVIDTTTAPKTISATHIESDSTIVFNF